MGAGNLISDVVRIHVILSYSGFQLFQVRMTEGILISIDIIIDGSSHSQCELQTKEFNVFFPALPMICYDRSSFYLTLKCFLCHLIL